MIDSTGNYLGIVIDCEYTVASNWMAFASWYSISKNLPDAEVIVVPSRGVAKFLLFNWTYRCGVPCLFHSSDLNYSNVFWNAESVIKINCMTMAIWAYNEFGIVGPLSIKSDEFPTFVDYSDCLGSFVAAEWINRFDGPFAVDVRSGSNVNEMKVVKLWKKMAPIFNEVTK